MDMGLLQKRVADLQTSSQVNIKTCCLLHRNQWLNYFSTKNDFFCA